MRTTFNHDPKRPLTLRRTTGGLSGGTRVEYITQNDYNHTVLVEYKGERIVTEQDNLVQLRKRELKLPGAELRRKMALALGSSS
jgi:hypothetical protein